MEKIQVALTIDDLPKWPHGEYAEGYTPQRIVDRLIEALDKHGIPGVYSFSNSWPLVGQPELAEVFDKWVDAGHHVANHTHSHSTSHELSADEYIAEIDLCEKYLQPWMSKAPAKYFRYTFDRWGNTEEKVSRIRSHLRNRNYLIGEVSSWFYEWEWDKAFKRCLETNDQQGQDFLRNSFLDYAVAQLRYDSEEGARRHGSPFKGILLGHVVPFMAVIADEFLARLIDAGVEFIPFEEAADDPMYDNAGTFVSDRFLTHWRKVAHHEGVEIPTIAPGFDTTYERVQMMAEDPQAQPVSGAPDRPNV